jgi:hypothetical protein
MSSDIDISKGKNADCQIRLSKEQKKAVDIWKYLNDAYQEEYNQGGKCKRDTYGHSLMVLCKTDTNRLQTSLNKILNRKREWGLPYKDEVEEVGEC